MEKLEWYHRPRLDEPTIDRRISRTDVRFDANPGNPGNPGQG